MPSPTRIDVSKWETNDVSIETYNHIQQEHSKSKGKRVCVQKTIIASESSSKQTNKKREKPQQIQCK